MEKQFQFLIVLLKQQKISTQVMIIYQEFVMIKTKLLKATIGNFAKHC